jgi:outer membrane translocation and assembly module TamA
MGEGLAAVAQRLTLYDFRLYNGKRLGDATVEDIESSIKQYLAQATDMAAKAAWLQLVVDRMHRCDAVADTTVQMIIDADTLANLAKRSL